MIRRPPRATRTDTLFPTRRASDLDKGKFRVAGTDKEKSIAEIAFTAYVPHNYPADVEPGLDETAFYDPLNFTYPAGVRIRSEEHTSELQSLMSNSYAVFCLKQKTYTNIQGRPQLNHTLTQM